MPQSHFSKIRQLLLLEEEQESARYIEGFLNLSLKQREESGKSLLNMRAAEFHFSPAEHQLITFVSDKNKELPVFSLDVGDVVTVSEDPNELHGLPIGTVFEKSKDEIVLAFNRRLPSWLTENSIYHLNRAGMSPIYQKMSKTLDIVESAVNDDLSFFRDLSLGIKKPNAVTSIEVKDIDFFNTDLNKWQKEAVQKALSSKDVSLIHGPPGTGKSTVLVEIIQQALKEKKSVFVTAPSNTACDLLLERMLEKGVSCLRLGHPARVKKHLHEHTLDYWLAHHPYAELINEYESEIHHKFKKQDRRKERVWIERSEMKQTRDEVRFFKMQIKELQKNIGKQLVSNDHVFVGTHTSAMDPIFRNRQFDLVVMDETTQGIEPSSWVPILFAKKIILAGDHCQLSPTVFSEEAKRKGLGISLFERLIAVLDEDHKSLLRVQYRMNENIMNFPSKQFYDNKLIADDSVKGHLLKDLDGVKDSDMSSTPVLFLDTAGKGFEEQMKPGSESRYNDEEAVLLIEKLNEILELGANPKDVCVISPYKAQVQLLTRKIDNRDIEVRSVDGFQGREKEVVLISLVRSNVEGELGFLNDTRRMNVAMTRAKRKLIVIGDGATLASIPFYKDFIQYTESIGAYKSCWE